MNPKKTYVQVVSGIESIRDVPAKPGRFERFQEALHGLSLIMPHKGQGVILIAGTNGKGSTAKTLEILLLARGEGVGLFTSPHIINTTERIRSFGRDLTEDEFVQAFELIEPSVHKWSLSRFEILTLMMAEVFWGGRVRPPVERAVIEVGVGGRLDPTRALSHEVSVVTRLGLDHQAILGSTLFEIAREKFAIVEPDNLVVYASVAEEVQPVVDGVREARRGNWIESAAFPFRVNQNELSPVWIIQTPWGEAELGLLGQRAVENTSIALRCLQGVGVDVGPLLPSLKTVRWPCRMEGFLCQGKRVYISGDHNPQGVESLIEILNSFCYRKICFVVGVGENKPVAAILDRLAVISGSQFYLAPSPFRGGGCERYEAWASQANQAMQSARVFSSAQEALLAAIAATEPEDLVVVTGSLYLAGALRAELTQGHVGDWKFI